MDVWCKGSCAPSGRDDSINPRREARRHNAQQVCTSSSLCNDTPQRKPFCIKCWGSEGIIILIRNANNRELKGYFRSSGLLQNIYFIVLGYGQFWKRLEGQCGRTLGHSAREVHPTFVPRWQLVRSWLCGKAYCTSWTLYAHIPKRGAHGSLPGVPAWLRSWVQTVVHIMTNK